MSGSRQFTDDNEPMTKFTIYMSQRQLNAVKTAAKKDKRSISSFIAIAVESALEQHPTYSNQGDETK
jgi:hypothetical protein